MKGTGKVKLTKRVVEAAADTGAERMLWDLEITGFGLRLRDGRKVYVLRYGTGRRHRARKITIGEHGAAWRPDSDGSARTLTAELAREEALRLLGARAEGKDPAQARAALRAVPTLEEFSKRYLTDHVEAHKKESSQTGDRGNLRLHVLPALGQMRMDLIRAAEVTRMHVAMKSKAVTANRCLALVSHVHDGETLGPAAAGPPEPLRGRDLVRREEAEALPAARRAAADRTRYGHRRSERQRPLAKTSEGGGSSECVRGGRPARARLHGRPPDGDPHAQAFAAEP